MKTTTATKKHDAGLSHPSKKKQDNPAKEEEVAVIVDVRTKAEYYMFIVDSFCIDTKDYVVMIPYEPARIRSPKPELVILRAQTAKNGDQLYLSIRDKKELEGAFDLFFKRFEESSKT